MDIDFGLQIDLSDSPNHFVDLDSDNAVLIKDLRTFRTVMKIRSFLCDRRVDNTNCGKIVWEWEVQKKYDNFISLQSLNFFKLNQKERFVDDKQGRGYQITVTDDNTMYQLSEYIWLLWKDWIGWKIYDRLSSLCTNNEFTMTQSESFELKKSNNNWFAIIKGKSDKWETIQCEIYLDDSSKQGVNFELINILPL